MKCVKDVYDGIKPCLLLSDFIKLVSAKYDNMVAFKTYNMQWTYRELYSSIRRCCSYFLNRKKKYYCIDVDNPFNFCVLFFAIIVSGKVAVLGKKEQFSINSDDIEQVDISDYLRIVNSTPLCECPVFDNENEVSVVALSSGTTSISKGVMLSQRNLLSDTFSGAIVYGYPKGAIYLNILPYTHLFGIVGDMLGPLASGGTICFSDNKLNMFKDLQAFSPTHMNLPPAVICTIEKALSQSHNVIKVTGGMLRKIMCAGAKLEDNIIRKMLEYNIEVFTAYGLTECSPCVSMNTSYFSKLGSVGQILPCCKVKIEDGEIVVRGENIMIGYLDDSESTQKVIRDGWLHTGDLGYIDNDGYLYITGRISNIIVLENGEKISVDVLESDLCQIKEVDEVLVTPYTKNNRILLNITVVTTLEKIKLLEYINECIKKYGINNRINHLTVTSASLKKNRLGKVIRR